MFRDLVSSRLIQAGLVFFVLVVGGSLLYYWHVHRTTEREMAQHDRFSERIREKQNESPLSELVNANEAAETVEIPAARLTTGQKTPEGTPARSTVVEKSESAAVRRVQTSTNPMFADGVPEHLQCPEEWIGNYLSELPSEAAPLMQKIAAEVIDKYNPNRPLTNIWNQYIAAENAYQNDADPEKGNLAVGANRFDWYLQTILDFPEIVTLGLEDGSRFADMRMIDMGIQTPDWNLHILPDGREFRAAPGYYYTVFSRSGTEDNYRESRISFGHSGRDATSVRIDLANTTDADLERLGGWNYNINPYTSGFYRLGDNPRQIDLGDYK